MNVLSLFDGISCGQIALERAGIKVDNYFSSEIDKNCIRVTQYHYPQTIQLGDISQITSSDLKNLPKIDLIIGGSPCQGFSNEGMKLNFSDKRSVLFFDFVRILKEISPRYFILENVRMKKEWANIISEQVGVLPIGICSSLVSAQTRKRLYWTNIENVVQPQDKQIFFGDIRCDDNPHYCSENFCTKFANKQYVRKEYYIVYKNNDKVRCLVSNHSRIGKPKCYYNDRLRFLSSLEWERLQTLPDNYTQILKYDKPRLQAIGNCWTVNVISHILSFI